MNYKELKVSGFLGNFIQCFWEYENVDAEIEHTILPDGYFDLISEYENGVLTRVKLTGVWTKPIKVTIPRLTKIFAIRFKLIAAEYLFKQEIKSLLDCSKILPFSVWGINTLSSDDFENFASSISNQVTASLRHLKEIDNRKIKLFRLIYQDKKLSIKALSQQVFWSSRQMNRYFNNQYGFPLKVFINIVRCNAAYPDIARGKMFSGDAFFDQSHFIKEIKKYTGSTPTELYKNESGRFLQLGTAELA